MREVHILEQSHTGRNTLRRGKQIDTAITTAFNEAKATCNNGPLWENSLSPPTWTTHPHQNKVGQIC